MHFTLDTFSRSLANYQEAVGKLFALCPELRFYGSGSPILGALEGKLEPDRNMDQAPLLKHATTCRVEHRNLFDWNRPLEPTKYLLDYPFFSVGFSIEVPWISYTNERAWSGTRSFSDGRPSEDFSEPECVREHQYEIRLQCQGKGWTLNQWNTHAAEIITYGDELPAAFRADYHEKYREAGTEVERWLKASNERPAVSLP